MPRTAEIIAVGSELLTGGVTNTNARFLSELLTAAGVDVLYHTAVGDDEGRLEAAVTAARQRAELLVFTGGLGDEGAGDLPVGDGHVQHAGDVVVHQHANGAGVGGVARVLVAKPAVIHHKQFDSGIFSRLCQL